MNKVTHFKYIKSFDSLRGVGCLFVLLIHGSYGLFKGAWVALDLFFILSGYLITSILQKEYYLTGKISLAGFYKRRAVRILPPLLICILLANILWSVTPLTAGADRILATLGGLFYFTNFLQVRVTGNMIHLWSLSVEEHFYLFWPLILLFLIPKTSFRKWMIMFAGLIIAVAIFRIFAFNLHFSWQLFTIDSSRSTFCRIDNISTGVLLSLILNKKSVDLPKWLDSNISIIVWSLFFIFITILLTISETNAFLNNGGFLISDVLCAFMMFIAIKKPDHYLFSNKLLSWIGKRSYSLYLYHVPIFLALEPFRKPHNIKSFLFVTVLRFSLSIIAAALSYKYIEQPFLKFKWKSKAKKEKNNSLEPDTRTWPAQLGFIPNKK